MLAATLEEVTGRLRSAFEVVASNQGAPGLDGQSIEEVREHLEELLPKVAESLLRGEYEPGNIRRVWIPKAGGEGHAVPFGLIGAMWLVYLPGNNLSLAVWVGVIALAGLDAETGLVMLLYLDQSFEHFRGEGRMRDDRDLWHAVHDGAVRRIRPKMMTVAVVFTGLVPLLWGTEAGADTMSRLAAPMIGWLATSLVMELLVYPALFYEAKRFALRREHRPDALAGAQMGSFSCSSECESNQPQQGLGNRLMGSDQAGKHVEHSGLA